MVPFTEPACGYYLVNLSMFVFYGADLIHRSVPANSIWNVGTLYPELMIYIEERNIYIEKY